MHATTLFDAPLVAIHDVVCASHRGGPGDEEPGAAGELILPRRGVFAVHHGREAVTADPATALVLGPDGGHRVSHPAHGGDACTVLRFRADVLEEALGDLGPRHGVLRPATQLAARLLPARVGVDPLLAEDAAAALLDAVARDLAGAPVARPVARARVEHARAVIAADPTAPWRLDAVARAAHCSPFHLARQFRAVTGESIARYVIRLRLAIALDRIEAGEEGLARLAADTGFASHSHLTATLRATFGTTPTELRTIATARGPRGA